MSKELMEYFNSQPRLGTLSTANSEGKVNVAYFGSAQMTDENTVIVGLGHNRTFTNLRENPLCRIHDHATRQRGYLLERGAGLPKNDRVPGIGAKTR